MKYNCNKCNKGFQNKCDYSRHKSRKTPCDFNNNKEFKCLSCKKSYSTKGNLSRHLVTIMHLEKMADPICSSSKKDNSYLSNFNTKKEHILPNYTCEYLYDKQRKSFSVFAKNVLRNSPAKKKNWRKSEKIGENRRKLEKIGTKLAEKDKKNKEKICRRKSEKVIKKKKKCSNDNLSEDYIDSFDEDYSDNYNELSERLSEYTYSTSESSDNFDTELFECNFCHKKFTLNKNLKRHLKNRCIIKKTLDDEKEKIYQSLIVDMKNEISDLKNTLNTMVTNVTNVTNNINNSNNTINNVNIQMVAFGSEDKSYLTNTEIYNLLKKGFKSIPELVKKLHFDENRPEHHNVYMPRIDSNFVMVFDGEEWGLQDRDDTIEDIFDDGRNFLVIKRDEFNELLDDTYRRQLKKFDRFHTEIDDVVPKKGEIFGDIKLILYNKRNIPLKTKKMQENSLINRN
jgi:hypothetical protein